MKTHYELLSLGPGATSDEIKHAFRREIARYHPDKVQHLGPEFQDIASQRAAELTEAYRVLMDPAERQKYDESLVHGHAPKVTITPPPSVRPEAPPRSGAAQPAEPNARAETPLPKSVREARDTITDFLRKATAARLRAAVEAELTDAQPLPAAGFDLAVSSKGKRGLFKKNEPPIRLLAKIVSVVDRAVIEEVWPVALKACAADVAVGVLLLGQSVDPARDLGAAIAEQRRKSRNLGPVIVPVDIRDWDALFPPETPGAVRAIIDRLKQAQ